MIFERDGETYVSGKHRDELFCISSQEELERLISQGMPAAKERPKGAKQKQWFVPVKEAQRWFATSGGELSAKTSGVEPCRRDVQLCEFCENAVPRVEAGRYTRGCEWSIGGKPVPGWTAEPCTVKTHGKEVGAIDTFHIKDCPKFTKDTRR